MREKESFVDRAEEICALTSFDLLIDWLIDLLLMDQQLWFLSLRKNRVKYVERAKEIFDDDSSIKIAVYVMSS